jgi:hypothetical protein
MRVQGLRGKDGNRAFGCRVIPGMQFARRCELADAAFKQLRKMPGGLAARHTDNGPASTG